MGTYTNGIINYFRVKIFAPHFIVLVYKKLNKNFLTFKIDETLYWGQVLRYVLDFIPLVFLFFFSVHCCGCKYNFFLEIYEKKHKSLRYKSMKMFGCCRLCIIHIIPQYRALCIYKFKGVQSWQKNLLYNFDDVIYSKSIDWPTLLIEIYYYLKL